MLRILSIVMYCFARTLHFTYRYRFVGHQKLKNLKENNKNFIFAIWHQNLLSGILAQKGHPYIVIVSKSRDAEAVAFTCKKFGHFVVRGSSRKGEVDKGGRFAKEEMIEHLKLGYPGAVTVDGPRGPALKVKPGIIDMAKQSNALLIPYTTCSSSYWTFNSWDKFQLPKPFAKILIAYGDPIEVDPSCHDFLNDQIKLENALNELTLYSNQCLLAWNDFSSKNWYE